MDFTDTDLEKRIDLWKKTEKTARRLDMCERLASQEHPGGHTSIVYDIDQKTTAHW